MSPIRLTERASGKIRTMLTGEAAGHGLRIGVDPGGCTGYRYSLALAAKLETDEQAYPQEGFDVFVPSAMLPLLRGLRIDYVESLTSSGFTFDNPNAGDPCGCGTSFTASPTAEREIDQVAERMAADVALTAQVESVIVDIRPYLRSSGGDVTVVEVADGVVRVALTGACGGCSMAEVTTTAVIERRLKEQLPQVQRVVLVP